jgi:methyltransferase (TIGR00027 family)
MTAVARALHRELDDPRILDDELALLLAGEEGPAVKSRLQAELTEPMLLVFSRWVSVRARVAEDTVERALAEGVGQYVILGAGLDSFAYRRPGLLSRLRVFEVDHPASQAWKRQRLEELGIDCPAGLVFAAVDFETQTLREGLEPAGFDFGAPALVSWIGVTMYLTLEAIEATLATVAESAAGTRIVMTYDLPLGASGDRGRACASVVENYQRDGGALRQPVRAGRCRAASAPHGI